MDVPHRWNIWIQGPKTRTSMGVKGSIGQSDLFQIFVTLTDATFKQKDIHGSGGNIGKVS